MHYVTTWKEILNPGACNGLTVGVDDTRQLLAERFHIRR